MQARRRIDQVLDPAFVEGLDDLSLDDIRERRQLAGEVENELSYYRRLLHGRMDLIRFEQRRRRGEETRSLIEALPQILADQGSSTPPRTGRHVVTDLPILPDVGKRPIDQILGDDVLLRLDAIDDDGLAGALDDLAGIESDLSESRRQVQEVEDVLATVLAERYRSSV
jgi:hypothetical protein